MKNAHFLKEKEALNGGPDRGQFLSREILKRAHFLIPNRTGLPRLIWKTLYYNNADCWEIRDRSESTRGQTSSVGTETHNFKRTQHFLI